jgi:hypothetical protein
MAMQYHEKGPVRFAGPGLPGRTVEQRSSVHCTQVHVSWIDSGTAVFSFRGTESTQDGLQDIKMMRRCALMCITHKCPSLSWHEPLHV